MKQTMNEEAVSPVIGVILMVAITVILAAVIAAFVFGMAGSTQTSKNVGLVGSINSTGGLSWTVQGGTDIGAVTKIALLRDGATNCSVFDSTTPLQVGQILVTSTNTWDYRGHKVTLVASFKDGSDQVVFDRT